MSEFAGMALGIRWNDIFRQIPANSNIFHSDSVEIHRNDIFQRILADCSESAGFHRNPWGRVKYCLIAKLGYIVEMPDSLTLKRTIVEQKPV
jgi:hypothetical protein